MQSTRGPALAQALIPAQAGTHRAVPWQANMDARRHAARAAAARSRAGLHQDS
jgi:hypothetical protein